MDKIKCFIIEGKELYLDHVLVDYNGMPILFICQDNNEYFLVLCSDLEILEYYLIHISIYDLRNMFCKERTMRDMFLESNYFYRILSEDKIEEDKVEKLSISEINKEVLPDKGAYFKILTKKDREYYYSLMKKHNMRKVIFLDVDGVLNNYDTFRERDKLYLNKGIIAPEIDEIFVGRLKEIVDKTGAEIILSSSWRNGIKETYDECSNHCKELIDILSKYNLSLSGKTPNLKGNREEEIKLWLKENKDVEKFIILDDETTFLMDFVGKELIKTSKLPDGVFLKDMKDCTGLQDEHVKKAIYLLKDHISNKKRL